MTETDNAREVERLLHANKLEEYDGVTGRLTIDAHETLPELEDFIARAVAAARAEGFAEARDAAAAIFARPIYFPGGDRNLFEFLAERIRALDPSSNRGSHDPA